MANSCTPFQGVILLLAIKVRQERAKILIILYFLTKVLKTYLHLSPIQSAIGVHPCRLSGE